MKRKTRKIKDVYKTTCGVCGDILKYRANLDATNHVTSLQGVTVKHYESKHPDRMAQCYDVAGQSWNAQYDTCLKALHATNTKLEQAIKERDGARAHQRTLAAKLNAIVLVLRND